MWVSPAQDRRRDFRQGIPAEEGQAARMVGDLAGEWAQAMVWLAATAEGAKEAVAASMVAGMVAVGTEAEV